MEERPVDRHPVATMPCMVTVPPRPRPEARAFHPNRPGLLLPMKIDETGLAGPTPHQVPGRGWRRTSRGRYLPASVPVSVEQRIVEAGVLLPWHGAVTGWAALRWLGARWFDGRERGAAERPVVLAVVRDGIRDQPGIRVCGERLAPAEVVEVDGLRVTSAVRSVCFEMRYAVDVRAATVALDMAAAHDGISLAEVAAFVAGLQGWTGVPQCRVALALGSENSWSPMEVEMRLHWELDAGLPRPLMNQPVFDVRGRHVGTPDLLDLEAGVVGEYDGSVHLQGRRRAADIRREHAFRELGLEYFTMVAADRADPLRTVVPRMLETRRRARHAAERDRGWTIVPPAWWTPTETVAQRRSLSAAQRERLLGRRAG